MSDASERRDFQRLRLVEPILAMVGGQNALILDLGIGGAFVEHYGEAAPGGRCKLLFRWKAEDIDLQCEIVHTNVVRGTGARAVSHSGLRFTGATGESEQRLIDVIAVMVGRILAAQRLNAWPAGDRFDDTLSRLGAARRARTRHYLSYRFNGDGSWSRAMVSSDEQPENGFTVAAYEEDEDLELLCRAWETGDDDTRNLIRVAAELSARTVRKG